MRKIKTIAWTVYLHGTEIDIVFFNGNMSAEEVKEGLVNCDGYHPEIEVSIYERFFCDY